jgi:hypothetical protein
LAREAKSSNPNKFSHHQEEEEEAAPVSWGQEGNRQREEARKLGK